MCVDRGRVSSDGLGRRAAAAGSDTEANVGPYLFECGARIRHANTIVQHFCRVGKYAAMFAMRVLAL
jgi:hypothetical protein